MKKDLEELRKNALIDIYSWGGLGPTPGCSGTIITKDRKIYTYYNFHSLSSEFKNKGIPDSYLGYIKKLTEEEYYKIEEYIEENIINKKYESVIIRDASFHVDGSFKNIKFKLTNAINDKGEIIYFDINELIYKIKGEIKNEEK